MEDRVMASDGLTWRDIRAIVRIADDLLDNPETRVAVTNHDEEYYYERVLDEFREMCQAAA
jgi:hypothetical protein